MAGVPGLTPAQRATLAGPDKRDPNSSALGTIGRVFDKMGFGGDRRRSRLAAGFASQWYGLDEHGNPSMGEKPGIVDETISLAALPSMVAKPLIDEIAKTVGMDPNDPYFKLMAKIGYIPMYEPPSLATEAEERSSRLHDAVREDMGLEAPKGFEQNAQESLGVMLGQLPVPGPKGGRGASNLVDKVVDSPVEWFTPTVRPSGANYATGAGFGGALGAAADGAEEDPEELPVVLPGDQPGLWDVRPTYSDGSIGYSKNAEDQEHAEGGSVQDDCDGGLATISAMRSKYAGGGKVPAIKAVRDAIAHLDAGDMAAALQTLQSSPDALRDPNIARAVQGLSGAAYAEGGKVRRVAMTLAEAKKIVASHGHSLVKSEGEYMVKRRGERTRIEGPDSHYFTNDIEDAVGTSAQMAKQRALKP